MKTVKAVIQAGGLGTRMQILTENKMPKPMLRLNGKPMIEWQIEAVIRYGIRDIVIIIGYLGEQIIDYFGDGSKWGIHIDYIRETNPLGSAGALYYLKEMYKHKDCLSYQFDDYLFIFGDVMFDMDIDRLIRFHRQMQAKITLVVHPNSHPYDSDLLISDKDEHVTRIIGKLEERTGCCHNQVNSGISVFTKDVLDKINKPIKTDWEKDVVSGMVSTNNVYAYRTSEYIKDVGTPERYYIASTEQKKGIWTRRNLSNKQRCIFLDRDGTINKYVGLVKKPEQIALYPGVGEALRLINTSGFLSIVVTNQPVVARGMCSEDDVRTINARLETLLGEEDAFFDDIVFCPHHPDKGYPEENRDYKIKCECRKPAIGMIRKMQKKYNIDLSNSYMVGDTTVDIQTGINAGLHTILLRTGKAGNDRKYNVKADFETDTLFEAIKLILQKEEMI